MDFLELAQKRYSCRKFSDKPVEEEKIDKIIQAGILAPTAMNKQPFKIWEIKGKNIEKIAKATPFTFGASVILAIGAKSTDTYVRPFDGKNFFEIDAAIAATHMMLEVTDLGLGTTWVGHFDPKVLKQEFPQMNDYEVVALFPIGYPLVEPSDRHKMRKTKEEVLTKI